jgi:transketolase
MRVLPNMRVADAGDNADLQAIMQAAMKVDGPVYFRVTRYTFPDIFGPTHTFAWGKGEIILSGGDVTLFGTGMMTSLCLRAAEQLEKDHIHAEVAHLASIKPIDARLIGESVSRTKCAVTAENASIIGGFGAAVAETLGETHPVPLVRIGVQDRFVTSGGTADLFRIHHMLPEDIVQAARKVIDLKCKGQA